MSKARIIVKDMMIIMAAMIVGLGIQETLLHFFKGIRMIEMPWYIPLTIVLAAFLCALPSAFINDMDHLTKEQINVRIYLHFICLKLVVTICGYVFGWYSTGLEYAAILIVFLIIYVSVWLISWWFGKRDAESINRALKGIQDKE